MRKITAGLFISLDGVADSPGEWHFPWWSDAMSDVLTAQFEATDTMLLGRVSYEEFAGYWADKTEDDTPGADFMNGTPKLVVSNTLTSLDWQNSTLVSGDVNAQLAELKQQPGKNISITGSLTLTRSLLRDGLLDELHLLVHPVVIGKGKRLFEQMEDQQPLELVESRTINNGVLYLTYRPGSAPTE